MSENFEKLDDKELHRKFCSYGANAKEWMRKCELLLPEIDRRKIWKKRGYENVFVYAAALAGMSRYRVEQALRVVRKVEQFPELRPVVEAHGVGAVRPILGVVHSASAGFWAEKAGEMSTHALEAYVRAAKEQGLIVGGEVVGERDVGAYVKKSFENEAEKRHAPFSEAKNIACDKGEIVMKLPKELVEKLRKLKGVSEWEVLMGALVESYEREIVRSKPVAVEATSRHIPAKIERYVLRRSGGTCEFSRCIKPYYILHHTQRFALEPAHDPDRIVALCFSHERMVHHGLIENELLPAGEWKIVAFTDQRHPKSSVDHLVMKYRKPK